MGEGEVGEEERGGGRWVEGGEREGEDNSMTTTLVSSPIHRG